jgi:class 3 adenylate cyclase/tetratricopeptide (TPR) repeat protein
LIFADISGFTALSEKFSTLGREGAEQITDIINRTFRSLLDEVFAYGGDLWKFGGDALTAFFPDEPGGLPGSVNALRASCAMQRAMSAFREVKTSLGVFSLQMKVGVNAGSIFAARVGTATERQFMFTGSAVNAIAHAEGLATAGQVLASPAVYQQVSATRLPFRFSPGAGDHFLVEQVEPAPPQVTERPSATDLRRISSSPEDFARHTLSALDRLTPYLPAGLLPRLIAHPTRQEASGEYRLVSILFANFIGASDLVDRLGLGCEDDLVSAINRYYVTMQQMIARYGGTVNKLHFFEPGDELIALFGAPIAHEDDAERAVRAALDMQGAVGEAGPMLLSQRIGITTGVVFAGHVGGVNRREYTVMGDDVNLANRLMSAASQGELLFPHSVRRKVAPFFEIADRGQVRVKGKAQPISIFTVAGRKSQPELVRGIRGLHSPLVGRAKERQVMQELADGLCAGRGSIVSLIGEAGLGKSRLIAEMRDQLCAGGQVTWLESQCLSYAQNVSYSAFTQVVRDALGILDTDRRAEMWNKLGRRMDELLPGEAGEDILPYLAHFLNLPLSGAMAERVAYLDGEALQRQVLRAVSMLLERMAQQCPLVLRFEDLHWADSASLALLERVLSIAERAPALICLLYRPDRTHGCWSLRQAAARNYPHCYTEITLGPLDVQAGEDKLLVRNLLSMAELPPQLAQLIARAEGNPFYIEEIIRTLIEARAITRSNSHPEQTIGASWRMAEQVDAQAVPDTLQGLIMTRMDRLGEEPRRTMQLASVVGRAFKYHPLVLLAQAAGLAARLDASVISLQRAELVRERTRVPELEYGFAQAMFRDVAYESLLVKDRRVYHWLVGQQLEEMNIGSRRDEVIELLAHHYSLSNDQEKALFYLIKAGDKTRAAYANKEAISFYRQAEPLAEQLDSTEDKAAIAEGLGDVLFHVGEYDDALKSYECALSLRTEPTQQADLHRRIGAVHEKRGQYDAALEACARGVALLAPDFERAVEMARLLTLRARVYRQQGQVETAVRDGESSLAILAGTSSYRDVAEAHNVLGRAHNALGHVEQAIYSYERGLDILERTGDEYGASKIYNNLAIIYYQTNLERATDYFERSLRAKQRFGDIWGESSTLQNLGIVHYARRNYALAIDYYQRSLRTWERLNDKSSIADCSINLGEVYRALGDPSQAIVHLEKGLGIAQQIGATQAEAECHRQLAECCLEINQPERALVVCQEAIKFARKIGDRKEEAIICRVMGDASRQLRDAASAIASLEKSVAILHELNREFDLGAALYDYALALKESGQTDQARERLNEALNLFEKLKLPQEQIKVQAALEQLA